jgi:CDGSH-type Zn-finger protein/uncharacterized Fe-S cluster protein YjdI
MSESDISRYPGEKVAVAWDGRLCIHVGECVRAKDALFVAGRQPWCQPDLVSVKEARDVVERCPSGALTYDAKHGRRNERSAMKNTVTVSSNGPLFVRGDLRIVGAPDDMPGVAFRAALCRCGHSGNKPFCDGSHDKVGFADSGAVGETGDGVKSTGGTLTIKPQKNGPLVLSGNVVIRAGSGRMAWKGTSVALCRCGGSRYKPFCDGSHKENGFTSE